MESLTTAQLIAFALIAAISLAELVALWRGPRSLAVKLLFTPLVFVPLIGPAAYVIVLRAPAPAPEHLQARRWSFRGRPENFP